MKWFIVRDNARHYTLIIAEQKHAKRNEYAGKVTIESHQSVRLPGRTGGKAWGICFVHQGLAR